MKVALVHDWLYSISGAEKVLEKIHTLFPGKVYTLIQNHAHTKELTIPSSEVVTSFIQKLPFAKTRYPYYLPLFPLAIENLNVFDADLVLSSSSCVAKGVLTHSRQLHICYCHTPMRYLWDLYFTYLDLHGLHQGFLGLITKVLFHKLRNWDLAHAIRVDHFIANSHYVAKRIAKTYRRTSTVIYPPVNCQKFQEVIRSPADFYITASRLVPYKRIDLIIKAFAEQQHRKLVVIGEGPELTSLKKIATPNIEFLGYVSDEVLKTFFASAKAFIYMACEDFGLLPVEAQAAGLPVIAYGKGGVLETVIHETTGIIFHNQTEKDLIKALEIFERKENIFDPAVLQKHARQFSTERFLKEFHSFVQGKYEEFKRM